MTRFLFWNLNRHDLHGFVARLARQENADVIILAECPTAPAQLLEELNAEAPDYQYAPGNCGHLLFFTRFESSLLTPLLRAIASRFAAWRCRGARASCSPPPISRPS